MISAARFSRNALASIFLIVFALLTVRPASAVVELDITRGTLKPIPIAITAFNGATAADRELGARIAGVILSDLRGSGLFAPIDKEAFIEKIIDTGRTPRFADWRIINAQALLVGKVVREGNDRFKAEFRLWDVLAGTQLAGQQFFTRGKNWRRIGHIIADAVYQRLTGEKGYFDTRIVYVDESGCEGHARVKRLAIMDQDGHNMQDADRRECRWC